jgi:hypothetical protein
MCTPVSLAVLYCNFLLNNLHNFKKSQSLRQINFHSLRVLLTFALALLKLFPKMLYLKMYPFEN